MRLTGNINKSHEGYSVVSQLDEYYPEQVNHV